MSITRLLIFLSLFAAASALHAQDAVHARSTAAATQTRYTCPMHPEVVSDRPGTCPKCGMELVAQHSSKRRTSNAEHPTSHREAHAHDHGGSSMAMASSVNIAEPMSRESSGTAWIPDSTPMYGRMLMFGEDMLMLHGAVWPRYVPASTRRGDDQFDAPNWIMGMYSHPFSDSSQIGARAMLSLDPLTESGRGYPLLFQTGESWSGEALHDRQHPHDFFAELSLSYSQKLTQDVSAYFYFGMPGEPALGPPTFMHRLSAMDNPDAPISHHWQDSTHITFGVATVGVVWRNVKVEGSIFTGREPDEERYDFDRPRFDSFSGRISWNPTEHLALQVSHGYIKSPEALEPDAKLHRTTASAIYNVPLGPDANWSNSFVWGQNNVTHEGKSQSFLVESNLQWKSETVYARFEHVEKSGHELVLADDEHHDFFGIGGYTVGYVHDFVHGRGLDVGLGGQVTVNTRPDELDPYYGNDLAYSAQVFFRVRPSRMEHSGMQHTSMAK
jgi:hypothetical protein